MDNKYKSFLNLIVSKPEEAFPSDNQHEFKHSDELEKYLENFFYENLETINELFGNNQDWFYTLRIHTYCYLLCANGYGKDKLLLCLSEAEREDIINQITLDNFQERIEQLQPINIDNDDASFSLIKGLFNSWINLEALVTTYYDELTTYYLNNNLKIERIIVFEAPPFCGINKLDHFFISGGNYFTSFTFNKVYSFIKNNINIPEEIWSLNLPYFDQRTKKYKLFQNFDRSSKTIEIIDNINKAINSGIVYIDLSMIPLPLTSQKRKSWSVDEKFKINGKQLPIWLLEWSVKNLKRRFKEVTNPFSPTCQIAIGTPINTSSSIFEYYSNTLLKIDEDVYFDLAIVNSPEVYKKKPYLKGYTLKQFKFNVIDNITPTENFVKNAFDFPK
jgi:hypothetical protein